MKLLKYFLFIAILIASALFITKLDDSNKMSDILGDNIEEVDMNAPIMVQIPYIVGKDSQSIFGLQENIEIKYVIFAIFTYFLDPAYLKFLLNLLRNY